jgi:acyl-CoA dehydrogenase
VSKADSDLTRGWLTSRAFSIAGGSTEIQLNIISRRWLGLPVN